MIWMRGLLCVFSSAAERQVLNYGMYLCVGVWEWCHAGTPVDLGFSLAAELEELAEDMEDGVSSYCMGAVDAIRCIFMTGDVVFCFHVTLRTGILLTAVLGCIAPVIIMIILSKVYFSRSS